MFTLRKIETEMETWTKTYTLPGTHVFGMPAFSESAFNSFNTHEFQAFIDADMKTITLKVLLPKVYSI